MFHFGVIIDSTTENILCVEEALMINTTALFSFFLYFFFHERFRFKFNRGVSHYRILPISRDIGWPVQQLDYFRYKATYTGC